jgi:PAS domain S-box-containing protein
VKPLGPKRRLAIQYEIARALAEADALDDVSSFLLRTLSLSLGWEAAALWVADQAGTSVRCVDVARRDGALAPWMAGTLGTTFASGEGLPGRVLAETRAIWIADLHADRQFPRLELARAVGLRHGYALPILLRGRVVAVVELFAAAVLEVDPEQTAFLEAVAHQLGSFLERTEARRAVASSEVRKAGILNAALDAIVSADAAGTILEFNAAAERLFGHARDDAVGRHIADLLVPPDLREAHTAGLARYIATGEARILGQRVRVRAQRSDGTTVPVELTITEIKLDGQPMFTAFIRDITREEEAETARERFLEILSHELRTPVTAIYGGAQVVARPDLPASQRNELIADMGNEADRLYRLIENLIVLARAERGVDRIALEPVHVERVAERVAAAVAAHWPGVEFRLARTGSTQAVDGDETHVEQLLSNLLTNAAKYARAGGAIDVRVEHHASESIVRILDRGPGIDRDELGRLFEIDYRSPLTEGLAQGSGIGLFVARWLVDSMGGRIWAAIRPGGGCEFGFALRAVNDEAGAADDARDAVMDLDAGRSA